MQIGAYQDSFRMWVNKSGQMESGFITEHYLTAFVHTENFIPDIPKEVCVNLKV